MLVDIHPNFIEKQGKKEYVVISIEEFEKIREVLADYEDLLELRKVRETEKDKKSKSLAEVKKELGT